MIKLFLRKLFTAFRHELFSKKTYMIGVLQESTYASVVNEIVLKHTKTTFPQVV